MVTENGRQYRLEFRKYRFGSKLEVEQTVFFKNY